MKRKSSSLAYVLAVALIATPAAAQLVIDATGPHKDALRKNLRGTGGGVGRKLPLQVAVVIQSRVPREDGSLVLEFIVTNSGNEGLRIPISPDPTQVEPSPPAASYSFRSLGFSLRIDGATSESERQVGRAVFLYGNDQSGTTITLAPGETIRVLAEVALPADPGPNEKGPTLTAWASIDEVTITAANRESTYDSREVGYATSPRYTLQSLYAPAR